MKGEKESTGAVEDNQGEKERKRKTEFRASLKKAVKETVANETKELEEELRKLQAEEKEEGKKKRLKQGRIRKRELEKEESILDKHIKKIAGKKYYSPEIEEMQEELRRLTRKHEEEEKARKQAAEEKAQLRRKAEQAESKRKRQYEAHQNEIATVRDIADKMEDLQAAEALRRSATYLEMLYDAK